MEKVQRLQKETEVELERLTSKHYQEWEEMKNEEYRALRCAKTMNELKSIRQEYQQKFELLDRRQTDDYIQLKRKFTEKLWSLL